MRREVGVAGSAQSSLNSPTVKTTWQLIATGLNRLSRYPGYDERAGKASKTSQV